MSPQSLRIDAGEHLDEQSGFVRYGHLPTSAPDAEAGGLTMYYTGKACSHGHYSPRYTKSRVCVACQKGLMSERRNAARLHRLSEARAAGLTKARNRLALFDPGSSGCEIILASYVVAAGGSSIVPGVYRVDPRVWVPDVAFADAKARIKNRGLFRFDKESGVFYAPRVMAANPPTTGPAAAHWRRAIGSLRQTVAVAGIRASITTVLMDRFKESRTVRNRAVLEAWLGRTLFKGEV